MKNSEVYCAEKIHVNFEKFDNIINETTSKLIDDCDYDDSEQEKDAPSIDSYYIIGVECESVNGLDDDDRNNSNVGYQNNNYDNSEKDNDVYSSDSYNIVDVECESVEGVVDDRESNVSEGDKDDEEMAEKNNMIDDWKYDNTGKEKDASSIDSCSRCRM